MKEELNKILRKYTSKNILYNSRMDGYKIETLQHDLLQLFSEYEIEELEIKRKERYHVVPDKKFLGFTTRKGSESYEGDYIKYFFKYNNKNYTLIAEDDLLQYM